MAWGLLGVICVRRQCRRLTRTYRHGRRGHRLAPGSRDVPRLYLASLLALRTTYGLSTTPFEASNHACGGSRMSVSAMQLTHVSSLERLHSLGRGRSRLHLLPPAFAFVVQRPAREPECVEAQLVPY
jgi:hypothetical protein